MKKVTGVALAVMAITLGATIAKKAVGVMGVALGATLSKETTIAKKRKLLTLTTHGT